jgi:HlyD family secretion protein
VSWRLQRGGGRPGRRSARWGARLATWAVALLALGALYLWLRSDPVTSEEEVETANVIRRSLDREVSATGVIRPVVGAEIDVGSRISGIVQRIPVEVGELVTRGALLARIDPTELEAALAQARADLTLAGAQLSLARSSHERAAALAADGILSPTELEAAARDLEVAEARLSLEEARVSSARILLGYTEIRAPIGGVIADVTTREGETVAASFAAPTFVTIVDLERLEVQAYVDETDIGRVAVGQRATFAVDTYPEAEFSAQVTAINPKASLQNGVVNYVVRLEFEQQEGRLLRPEMTAHVRLRIAERSAVLTIPRRAVRRRQGVQFALVLRGGAWVEQKLDPGWRSDSVVEIRHGLAEGELVQLNRETLP